MAKEQKENTKGRQKQERPKREGQTREGKPREGANREVESADLMEKVLYINRCSKTVKGGRKMSFSALILVGDGKGRVGYGFAKANELTDAIRKGGELARKNLQNIVLEGATIPHEAHVKWDGATVYMRPAIPGTGVIAGSKVRAILEFAGVKDVMAKNYGTSNPINQVRATFKALLSMKKREQVMKAREAV
jgi:small subunit ribosomal protein S5